jgi:sugar/nucleoside kinase (ribokinase family)
MKKILGIGNALVDVMTVIDNDSILAKFGLPKGSMTLVDNEKSEMVKSGTMNCRKSLASGGSAANTIHGLAMLGAETGFIGSIGKDETGDFFENDLSKAGVETYLIRRESVTGTAVALISPDTERTFATHLGAAVELSAQDLNPDHFRGYEILYLEGYLIYNKPLITEACRIAKKNNMIIAIDMASYNVVETNLYALKEIVDYYADIVFANEEETRAFTGLGPEDALEKISENAQVAVVKVGKEGSWLKRGEELIKIGVLPVQSRDTTGAGDLYASGFLFGYANNLSLEKCGLIGALTAGKVIEIIGARINKESFTEIRSRIREIINVK